MVVKLGVALKVNGEGGNSAHMRGIMLFHRRVRESLRRKIQFDYMYECHSAL